MRHTTVMRGLGLLLAVFAARAPAQVQDAGPDCVRLIADGQRSAWVWHPGDRQRGVLVVDDGRVLPLSRDDGAQRPRLTRPWPASDCAAPVLPAPTLELAMADAAAAALVDAVDLAEDHESASHRRGGMEARAAHWRNSLARLRAAWTGVDPLGALVLERLDAYAAMAAADGGTVQLDLAPLEQRWRALAARLGTTAHASLEALTEWLWTLVVLGQATQGSALIEADWSTIAAALPASNRQRLQLDALRVRLRATSGGAARVLGDALAVQREARQALPPADPLRMDCELLSAIMLLSAGRSSEALPTLEDLAARIGSGSSRRAALVQDRLALLYRRIGRLSEGLLASQRAYRMTLDLVSPRHPDALRAINNHADMLRQLGDVDAALPFAQQAFAGYRRLYGDGHADVLISARNLSLQLGESQRAAEALSIVQPQVDAAAQRLPADNAQLLNTRIHLVELLDLLGRHAQAVAEGEAVLAPTERRFGLDGELTIMAYVLLAGAHAGAGNSLRAFELLAVAAERIELIDDQRRALALLAVAARAAERTGDMARHEALLRRFVDLAGRADRSGLSEDLASWVHKFRAGPHLRWTVLRAERGEIDAAFDLSERFKGRVLLSTLGQLAGDASPALPVAVRAELAAARQQVREAEAALAATTEPTARVAAGERREAAAQAYLARRDRARREHPRFAAVSEAPVLGSRDVPGVLGAGRCMLSFVTAAEHAGVFVLAPGQPIRWRTLPAPKDLEGLVQRLREDWSVAKPGTPAGNAAATEMARLLAPALADCPSRTTRLVISPDGALALLPLEPLVIGGRRLVDRYAIGYVQSFSVLAQLQRRGAPRGDRPLLAVGAPSFASASHIAADEAVPPQALRAAAQAQAAATLTTDPQAARRAFDAMGMRWAPLPGAARELRNVGRLFRHADVLAGGDASEENLAAMNERGELARYRLLLFSTHGFLSYTHPQLSAIVLRQPGSERHDGYLTAAELPLYGLDSQLVVLAACETGVGPVRSGSGVMGLPLALMAAGNRHTVVSLWSVPDQSTSELVTRLFSHVQRGVPPAEALARSKRELARLPRHAHPVNWAGFVVYGAP